MSNQILTFYDPGRSVASVGELQSYADFVVMQIAKLAAAHELSYDELTAEIKACNALD